MAKDINIGGRLHSTATGNVVAGADEILDDVKGKKQSVINADTDAAIQAETERAITAENNRYTKAETYSKQEVNSLITTPNQEYVTVEDYASLPESGEADTIYRVANWDGSLATPAADITKYSEYAWDGTGYVFLSVKSQIGEVFDISEYHSGATYADLAAALGTNGANVPVGVRKGGMSVKFKQIVTPASYTVVKTEGLDSQPTGTEIVSDPDIDSGTYNASQLSAFSTLPESTGAGNAVTYWMEVAGDTTTYTSWVITMAHSSDNNYVQFRYMLEYADTTAGNVAFVNPDNWQGVDDKPSAGSKNLVESGGVFEKVLNETTINESYNIDNLSSGAYAYNGRGQAITFSDSGVGADYKTKKIPCNQNTVIKCVTEGGSGTFRGVIFADSDNNGLDCSDIGVIDGIYIAPANTAFVMVNYKVASSVVFSLDIFKKTTDILQEQINETKTSLESVEETIFEETINNYTSEDLQSGACACSVIGSTATYATGGAAANFAYKKVPCFEGDSVQINTEGGSLAGTYRGLAFLDSTDKVLWCSGGGVISLTETAPTDTAFVILQFKITSSETFSATLTHNFNNIDFLKENVETLQSEVSGMKDVVYLLPQIAMNVCLKKHSTDRIRILCFGSSWLMNTWWYLPYILNNLGISSTLKCMFSSGAYFSQWVDRYDGKTEQEIGSTDGRIYTSTDGSDWSVTTYQVGDFKTALEEGWDVIIYQQGAYQSIQWESQWGPYMKTLLSYVRRSVGSNTIIAFNSTWTPAENGSLSGMTKQEWQTVNYNNCQKMCNICGLNNFVIPNGAAIWALRNDEVLTDANDFSSDGLHLKSGNPVLLTGLNLYETLIAPIYGIGVDNVTWYPDANTPKCPASGSSWSEATASGLERLKKMCKLSASDRFGFETL